MPRGVYERDPSKGHHLFQPGNKHAVKGAQFGKMLRLILTQEDHHRLREAINQLLDQAAAGEAWAIQMLADRMDGKAIQQVNVDGEGAATFTKVIIEHVKDAQAIDGDYARITHTAV